MNGKTLNYTTIHFLQFSKTHKSVWTSTEPFSASVHGLSQGEEGSSLNNPGILAKGGLRKRTLIFLPWGHCVPPLHVHSAFMITFQFSSVQLSHSVMSDSLRPHELQHAGLPVHHQLLEFTQTHVHRVSDVIQPSHPLSSPSPPAPNPSQHQGLFQWVNSSYEVAKYCSFSFSVSPSNKHPGLISFSHWWTGWISLQSKGLSRVFSDYLYTPHIPERD